MAIFRGAHKHDIAMTMKKGDVVSEHPIRQIYAALRDFLREAIPNTPNAPSNKGRLAGRGITLTGGPSLQKLLAGDGTHA